MKTIFLSIVVLLLLSGVAVAEQKFFCPPFDEVAVFTGEAYILASNSCVRLVEDVDVGVHPVILQGSTQLFCQTHELLGSGPVGIETFDTSKVHKCHISGRDINFQSHDQSRIHASVAEEGTFYGFKLYENSVVIGSEAINNGNAGFYALDSSTVWYSESLGNYHGYVMHESSSVFHSLAQENAGFGFHPLDTSKVFNSLAQQNGLHGFSVTDTSEVHTSRAIDNEEFGFYVAESAKVTQSKSFGNGEVGFVLDDVASVQESTTYDNLQGIRILASAQDVVLDAVSSCQNEQENILVLCNGNCVSGTVSSSSVENIPSSLTVSQCGLVVADVPSDVLMTG
jgi:hypothetical protein